MFRRSLTVVTGLAIILMIMLVPYIDKPGPQIGFRLDLEKKNHEPGLVTDEDLSISARSIAMNDFKQILKPILVERVVGTVSHENVKNYIIGEFKKLDWSIELDSFAAKTPNRGTLQFTNIVATHNPDAIRALVLACHYDSKLSDYTFIGATDSAIPCAMLIYLAKSLNNILSRTNSSVSLKLIFFDGEEAFLTWTKTDSLYGSRHLASLMESRAFSFGSTDFTDLDKIDLFVLLDLLGAPSPKFYSMFPESHRWYKLIITIEKRLRARKLLESNGDSYRTNRYFMDRSLFDSSVEDDHVPFVEKGVDVLHIIPIPFPRVWHTKDDDESAIDFSTVKNLLTIFRVFIIQYLSGHTVPT